MLERLKSIDYMYWASLIFMVFPIVPVVTGELPSWHLLIDILFVLAYLGVLTTKSQRLSWLCWVIMLAYVAGNTAFVGVNYIWFFFFLANLLIYHFGVRSFNSLHVRTFLLAQFLVVGQLLIFQEVEVEFLVYLLGIITFIDLMTFGLVRIRIVEDLKEAQAKQNAQINLLLAENERSRIGQDLHDSLGHTFAMLSVKTDLALQLFQMEAYPQVEKELREIQQISKESMREVRTIVENLKSRTLISELETVKKMLEIAGIEVQVDNHLDKASLTQDMESTAAMILLELATNIIKHAKALNAFTNPSTNSYKRLVPGFEAPVLLAYSASNRSASIRIPAVTNPKAIRIEARFPDPLANPYLAFAALLMAGLDGVVNKIHPGDAMDKNLYDLPPEELKDIPAVASSLEEALNSLEKDYEFLTQGGVFAKDFIEAFISVKRKDVERLNMTPHPVEFEMYYA